MQDGSHSLAAQILVQLSDVEGARFDGRLKTVVPHLVRCLNSEANYESVVSVTQSLTKIVRQCQRTDDTASGRMMINTYIEILGSLLHPVGHSVVIIISFQTNQRLSCAALNRRKFDYRSVSYLGRFSPESTSLYAIRRH